MDRIAFKMKFTFFLLLLFTVFCIQCTENGQQITSDDIWPVVKSETKPWTRWWWMGNAVTKPDIEAQLTSLANAGFGGVEITPIYGVKGYEDQYIDYLSEEWMEMLDFTISKADELGMGVDMNLGTGWPFGGPQINPEYASSVLLFERYTLKKGQKLNEKIRTKNPKQNLDDVKLLALMAYFPDGLTMDIQQYYAADGSLDWIPESDCEIAAAFNGKTRQKVKRSAPGGEGWTLNHFSEGALKVYLSRFDSAFAHIPNRPRSFFNDSYEVYGSSSTPQILDEFQKRRGYDLRNYLRELSTKEESELARRVQSDYRETFGELLMDEFTLPWVNWSNEQNVLTKNQAHGSPANIIDLYGAVDIPECETFGSSYFPIPGLRRDSADIRPVDPDPVMMKFATSAANILGKQQVSSETFTWLAEHFRTSLSQCKPELEQVFLAGVNHVFYHGTTFSPVSADWPGWLFYASVQFGPVNSFWPHVNGLNEYIARCQSVLQAGRADNDVLVYWPYYDTRNNIGRLDQQITIHNIDEWLHPTSFYTISKQLMNHGYLVDFATDDIVSNLSVENGVLSANEKGGKYTTLIVPACELMPVRTVEKLLALAKDGARIVFQELPKDVPGYYEFEQRRSAFMELFSKLDFQSSGSIKIATLGSGKIILSSDVDGALAQMKIEGENLTESGLRFVRRNIDNERYYYLVNHTANEINKLIQLNSSLKHAIVMNPDNGDFGKVDLNSSNGVSEIKLQLASGQSIIVRCTDADVSQIPAWRTVSNPKKPIALQGPWQLTFTNGGPEIPDEVVMDKLESWTELKDEKAVNFSGQGVYEYTVNIPDQLGDDYLLDLGMVAESARVWVNDTEAGILWGLPFQLKIGRYLKKGDNSIKVEVANLMANRIRYMDQKGIEWRKFHEINFVNIDYEPFDASGWKPMASGLLGPVILSKLDWE